MERAELIEYFQKWRNPIRSWLRNRAGVPNGDIDDLAQEVFLRLLRYCDDITIENPQGYLFRMAANVANEWRERSHVRQPHDDSWLELLLVESESEPDNLADSVLRAKQVQLALSLLTSRQQDFIVLHVTGGLTYKQIAVLRRTTERIVLRQLTLGYSALRGRLAVTRE